MKICDLITSANRLQKATQRLVDRWTETEEVWDDAVSREFKEKFVAPIPVQVQLTMAAIHQLAEVLDEAERACRDEEASRQ